MKYDDFRKESMYSPEFVKKDAGSNDNNFFMKTSKYN
jgi:hypothetical protein